MGFTFRGKHSNEFTGLVFKTVTNPLLPAKRIQRINVIGYDGEYIFENGYNNKVLEFKCSLAKGTIPERRKRAREIAAWLSATGDLVLDYENDKTYKVIKTLSDIALAIEQSWNEPDKFHFTEEFHPSL